MAQVRHRKPNRAFADKNWNLETPDAAWAAEQDAIIALRTAEIREQWTDEIEQIRRTGLYPSNRNESTVGIAPQMFRLHVSHDGEVLAEPESVELNWGVVPRKPRKADSGKKSEC